VKNIILQKNLDVDNLSRLEAAPTQTSASVDFVGAASSRDL
jgi:hypothetical protein